MVLIRAIENTINQLTEKMNTPKGWAKVQYRGIQKLANYAGVRRT